MSSKIDTTATEQTYRVNVLARAVASGVQDGRLKLTLALRPVKTQVAETGVVNLANWPSDIHRIFGQGVTLEVKKAKLPDLVGGTRPVPHPGNADDLGTLMCPPWILRPNDEAERDARAATRLWNRTVPSPEPDAERWTSFYSGLETTDGMVAPTNAEPVVCMSGGEGDIALLTKMARAIEATRMAASDQPMETLRELRELERRIAETFLNTHPVFEEFFKEVDVKEGETVELGENPPNDDPRLQEIAVDKNRFTVTEAKRVLALQQLKAATQKCAALQEEGAKLCGDDIDVCETIISGATTESCACEKLGSDLETIYRNLLQLRLRQLLAADMGEDEFDSLKDTAKEDPNHTEQQKREQQTYKKPEDMPGVAKDEGGLARSRLFQLEEVPDLGRLMRTFVDFLVPIEALPQDGRESFLFIRIVPIGLSGTASEAEELSRWSLAKVTTASEGTVTQFLPATREELILWACSGESVDANRLSQKDGVVMVGRRSAAGTPSHELISADLQTVAQDIESWSDRVLGAAWTGAGDPDLRDFEKDPEETDAEPWNLRSGGLSVVNFDCASAFSRRLGVARAMETAACGQSYLDADDLLTGRIPNMGILTAETQADNSIAVASEWLSMMRKTVTFNGNRSGGAEAERLISRLYLGTDDRSLAQLSVDKPTPRIGRRKDPEDPENKSILLATVAEEETRFLGDPLGVETGLDTEEHPIDDTHDLALTRDIRLPRGTNAPADHLTFPLRYGASGRIGFSALYLGGGTLSPEEAGRIFDKLPTAAVPALPEPEKKIPGRRFLRSEGVDPVTVLVTAREARRQIATHGRTADANLPPQTTATVTLRSKFNDVTGRASASGYEDEIIRVVMPPVVPLENAEQHGLFDDEPPAWFSKKKVPVVTVSRVPVWRTAYHKTHSIERPKDGLGGLYFDAPWGGYPLLRRDVQEVAQRKVVTEVALDFGASWLEDARKWSRAVENQTPGEERPAAPVNPPGDAVFARNSAASKPLGRVLPFYPDPMAHELVLRMRPETQPKLMKGGILLTVKLVEGSSWPDSLPIALRIRRGSMQVEGARRQNEPQMVENGTITLEGITCRLVEITLPLGVVCDLDMWCRPSVLQLAKWSELVDTVATLRAGGHLEQTGDGAATPDGGDSDNCGLLGLASPRNEDLKKVATELYNSLGEIPLPQVSGVRVISLSHAITRPLRAVTVVPLAQPAKVALEAHSENLLVRRVHEELASQDLGPDLLEPDDTRTIPPAWYLDAEDGDVENPPLFVVDPDGTEVDLAGYLEVDLPSTGAIEIFARAIGVKGGGFDTLQNARPLEDVLTGNFKVEEVIGGIKPEEFGDAKDQDIYGFAVSEHGVVSYPRNKELWARITNLPTATPEGKRTGFLSLHALFARAENEPLQDGQIQIEVHPLFADTRSRRIELQFRTISRFRDSFTPRPRIKGNTVDLGVQPEPSDYAITGEFDTVVMAPASSRPAAPKHEQVDPVIARSRHSVAGPRPVATSDRVSRMRLWLERPWDTSGRDEMLGVVVWPPLSTRKSTSSSNNPAQDFRRQSAAATEAPTNADFVSIDSFEARELEGADGAVSRWGSDPAEAFNPGGERRLPKRQPWHDWSVPPSMFADFRLHDSDALEPLLSRPDAAFVQDVRMPIPNDEQDEQGPLRQRYLNVDLLAYRPRFDVDSERWYVDIDFDPCIMINPFVQLGLVRYNTMAPRDLQVSFPGSPADFQIPSRRTLRVETVREGDTHAIVRAVVLGPATPELVFHKGDNADSALARAGAAKDLLADRNVATRMLLCIECRHRSESKRRFKAERLATPSKLGIAERLRFEKVPPFAIIDTMWHGAIDTMWSVRFRVPIETVLQDDFELRVYAEEVSYRPETDPNPEHLNALSGKSPRWLDDLVVPRPGRKTPGQ